MADRSQRVLLLIIAIGFFMQSLDATILNTALPSIAADLHASPLKMQMVVISYILTVALLIPTSGWLADRFGTQRLFLAAIIFFCLGSLLCSLSTTLWQLVAARVVQGIGGAFLQPIGRLVVLRSFPGKDFVRALSFVTIPALVGPLLGPTVGGWLAQYATWHWIFLINLPIGVIGLWGVSKKMPNFRQPTPVFDWAGFAFFGGGLLMLSLALQGLGDRALSTALSLCLLLAGCALQMTYWLRAFKVEQPLFSPSLFKIPTYAIGMFGNIFSRLGSGSMPFLTPLFLQLSLGFSPSKAGLMMIASAASAISAKTVVTILLARWGYRMVLSTNTILLGLMMASFALVTPQTPLLLLLVQLAFFGFINSVQFTAMNSLTLQDLGTEVVSSGNSLFSVIMQLSMSFGIAVSSVFLNLFSQDGVERAFHLTYLLVGALTLCASMIFLQVRREDARRV
ncbi:MAG: multidrug transporter subunit MdtD [Betaproteobacteria bacterium]|nr:multidrug transporter subunit MdtD [Betaproteobacteria bacterium]